MNQGQEPMNLLSSFKRVNAGKVDGWLDTLFDASWADIWKLAANWHEAPGGKKGRCLRERGRLEGRDEDEYPC